MSTHSRLVARAKKLIEAIADDRSVDEEQNVESLESLQEKIEEIISELRLGMSDWDV